MREQLTACYDQTVGSFLLLHIVFYHLVCVAPAVTYKDLLYKGYVGVHFSLISFSGICLFFQKICMYVEIVDQSK